MKPRAVSTQTTALAATARGLAPVRRCRARSFHRDNDRSHRASCKISIKPRARTAHHWRMHGINLGGSRGRRPIRHARLYARLSLLRARRHVRGDDPSEIAVAIFRPSLFRAGLPRRRETPPLRFSPGKRVCRESEARWRGYRSRKLYPAKIAPARASFRAIRWDS